MKIRFFSMGVRGLFAHILLFWYHQNQNYNISAKKQPSRKFMKYPGYPPKKSTYKREVHPVAGIKRIFTGFGRESWYNLRQVSKDGFILHIRSAWYAKNTIAYNYYCVGLGDFVRD